MLASPRKSMAHEGRVAVAVMRQAHEEGVATDEEAISVIEHDGGVNGEVSGGEEGSRLFQRRDSIRFRSGRLQQNVASFKWQDVFYFFAILLTGLRRTVLVLPWNATCVSNHTLTSLVQRSPRCELAKSPGLGRRGVRPVKM